MCFASKVITFATQARGSKQYELTDHLGNIRTVVPDIKEPQTEPTQTTNYLTDNDNFRLPTLTLNNYYPYGMLQAGRSKNAGGYRFGFNGKENDTKINSLGRNIDFGARGFDTYSITWRGVDPLASKFPGSTPFGFGAANPILYTDPDGRGPLITIGSHIVNGEIKPLLQLSGTIYLYGDPIYNDAADAHTTNAISQWNNVAGGKVLYNGVLTDYQINVQTHVISAFEAQSLINNQKPDELFIRVDGPFKSEWWDDNTNISATSLPAGAPSFIIGNLGHFNFLTGMPGNEYTSFSHEIGHWLGFRDYTNGDPTNTHTMFGFGSIGLPDPPNIMAINSVSSSFADSRLVSQYDLSRINYSLDFSQTLNSTYPYLGDRFGNGGLVLNTNIFNNANAAGNFKQNFDTVISPSQGNFIGPILP